MSGYIKAVLLGVQLLGLALIGLGLWLLGDMLVYLSGAEDSVGRVVSTIAAPGETKVRAVLEFTDAAGEKQEGTTHVAASHYAYEPGTELPIHYHPERPGEVRLQEPFLAWGLPAIFIIAGATALIAARIGARRTA